ncbi:hypothetical protein [Adhaeribacter aquaticus]|uniref:hypothetical protein n=1 Tax=Adhaeribacter aquaticus TaxID=299567 RepID=UPI0003F4F6D0|nr:hypothetical protein [Adhaeribacter aquaticus]
MNQYLKPNERELIKLIKFFQKRADHLIKEGALSEEHQQLGIACEKLTTQIFNHAQAREHITQKREKLGSIIVDNAACPKCHKSSHIKLTGTAKHQKGWKANKYKCRRCNIEFIWNKPNNPWDMVLFLEQYIGEMEANVQNETLPEEVRNQSGQVIEQLQVSLTQLKPVLEGSDSEMADLQATELEMSKMVHQFKNYLLIEKIKLDTWQDPTEK